jgi:sugar diacid utilization regulator
MLLNDLLADPELGLVLLAGAEHSDRPIRGVYITDLLDPRRYLAGGELVLSGLVWHNGPDDTERFVAALSDAGVAGLAAGAAHLGGTPPDLVDACRRYDVPVLEVPVAVSFNALSERILRDERRGSTPRRELVTAIAGGADLPQVLRMAADELGQDCWVLSAAGWLVGGDAELPENTIRGLIRHFLESDRLPRTVRAADSREYVLWPVSADTEPRVARWFVAVRGDQRQWVAEQEAVAADLGTAVALLRARLDEARQIAGRAVDAVLHRLLDGTAAAPEVAARLETAGLPTDELLRVVALDTGQGGTTAITLLREITAATGMASVAAPLRDGACALFVDDEEHLTELDERLRGITAEIEPGLAGMSITVGLSDIGTVSGLRGLLEEASYARRLAERRSGRALVVSGAELASHRVLLASVPDDLRRSYCRRLLSKLVTYDRAHHSDLVRSLRVFLECSGSWSRCARRLHVHVNTLRYRMRRIEELTGRDLSEFAVRVDFYLALELDAPESASDSEPPGSR